MNTRVRGLCSRTASSTRRGRAGDRGQRPRRAPPGLGHERRRREVVELVGARVGHDRPQAVGIEQVAVHDPNPLAEVLGGPQRVARRPTHHPDHLVAPLEQQLGEKRSVLTGDPRHQRPPRLAAGGHV